MHQITEEQAKKLFSAIDDATGHGALAYVLDGKPACVIAKLAAIEGVADSVMARWNDSIYNIVSKPHAPLKDYPAALLQYLQFIWDDSKIPQDTARQSMRDMVRLAATEDFEKVQALAMTLRLPQIG